MLKRTVLLLLLYASLQGHAFALELKGPYLRFKGDEVYVSFGFSLDSERIEEIRKGVPKELIFYIDLFRSWEIWPDEFITGRKVVRKLRSDPMKKEHIASSFDGERILEKRFGSFDSMLSWALGFGFRDLYLTSLRGLARGKYFVRVTVESRMRNIPSLFSEIFFFLPDREFKVSRDSEPFTWEETNRR